MDTSTTTNALNATAWSMWFQAGAFPVYHYLTLEVRDHRLHAVMWKVKDPAAAALSVEAKDEFTLTAPERKPGSQPR